MSINETIQPGAINVIKRNGTVVPYEEIRITTAIKKAFLDPKVMGNEGAKSASVVDKSNTMAKTITETFLRRMPSGGHVSIEEIQDLVELTLMRSGEHAVAREYVLYREEHARLRKAATAMADSRPTINVLAEDGSRRPLDIGSLTLLAQKACEGMGDVDAEKIIEGTLDNVYDGIKEKDLRHALIMSARALIERDPGYSYVTARILLNYCREEACSHLKLGSNAPYGEILKAGIALGVDIELLDTKLATVFDLDRLAAAILPERDNQFQYLGLQTLQDRYLLHQREVRFELPQTFFMRVAMGLAIQEDKPTERAIEFYELLSSFDYMCSTPTLFNAGTVRSQLSSCYLTTVPDDLHGIYGAIRDNAMLSKFAGGLGNDWTPVRSLGAYIKGTNGKSQGVVPFLKVANDTAVAVNQGGKRKGAVCAYLETWHMDIEEFLELRKNTGDDRRRTHDMNTANWIPDLFMKRVFANEDWTLFSPNDVEGLHDLYGQNFEESYAAYERECGKSIKLFKKIPAVTLWRKMISMLFETGHPWMTFKDPCNLRNPQMHAGVVHSSNLCTEITLNTSKDEIAVCNLGSVNLANHVTAGGLDKEKIAKTVMTAVRMLDNVIDINYYAVEQARNSNLKHRPVGLGVMGLQDALYKLGIDFGSDEAIAFSDTFMELISYHAINSSCDLAEERGSYQSFPGSLWSMGKVPLDTIELLEQSRGGELLKMDKTSTLDWDSVRNRVKAGIRNSNIMAIAPTATIANIVGVSQSIEPTYQNLFVKSNMSGEFTLINRYLVETLKAMDLWDSAMINDLKDYDGSLAKIDRIPDDIKRQYATAFEIEPKYTIEAASRRQKWIDQAQSLNLYIDKADGRKLDFIYRMAWIYGLKTTYYLRALAATSAEKSTTSAGSLNAVKATTSVSGPAPVPAVCSLDDQCEACQ